MEIDEAIVSGSLGQAILRIGELVQLLEAPDAAPRDALPSEIRWFYEAARDVVPVEAEGERIDIEALRTRLSQEIEFFRGYDGLLIGMDPDFSRDARVRAISRADETLRKNDVLARRIRARFLTPSEPDPSIDWDPSSGLVLAREVGAGAVAACYQVLADGTIESLTGDLAAISGAGDNGREGEGEPNLKREVFVELAVVEAGVSSASPVGELLLRIGEVPQLQDAGPTGQVVATLLQRAGNRAPPSWTDELLKGLIVGFDLLDTKGYLRETDQDALDAANDSVTLTVPYQEEVPPDAWQASALPPSRAGLIAELADA